MLLLCAATVQSFAQTTRAPQGPSTDPGELIDSGLIVATRFEGNENLSDLELGSIVTSKPAKGGPFGIFKLIGKIIPSLGVQESYADRVVLDQDVVNIEQYYQHNGFMEADAEYDQRFHHDDVAKWMEVFNRNRIVTREHRQPLPEVRDTIVFWISEGPEYKISGVSFVGLESLPEEFQPELTERNTIRVGERWSRAVADAEVARLQGILTENGYPFFKRDTIIAEVLVESKQVRVIPYINPGNRYKFGSIRIQYDSSREDSRVSDRVILGQMIDIDSGAWYKESLVREAEQYLYRLNTFEMVSIRLDTTEVAKIPQHMRDSMALPVVVRLRMRGTQEVTPGVYAGFGGDLDFSAGLTTGYINRNIFGGAQRFDLDLFWQPVPSRQQRYSAAATTTIPYMGWRNFPLTIGASSTYTKQKSEEGVIQFVDILHRLRFSSNVVLGGLDSRTSFQPEITAEYWDRQDEFDDIRWKQLNAITALYGQLDRSDDFLNATRGFMLNGGVEVGLPWLHNFAPDKAGVRSASYAKELGQFRFYDDLGSIGALILASKFKAGFTQLFDPDDPLRDPPHERRFYAGGSSSNRGWNSQQLLVSDEVDATAIDGGMTSLEATVEFRLAPWRAAPSSEDPDNLLSPLRLVLFTDIGNVWDDDVKIAMNQVAWTTGVGVRYNLPLIGPLRFDVGLKTYDPKPYRDEDPRRPSAIPSNAEGKWITERRIFKDTIWGFHFGIGQAF
jgi:outer membrane protein assembly factor BamA